MENKPRILYVTEVAPLPESYGGAMRCYQVARSLSEVGEVETAIVKTPGKTGDLGNLGQCAFPVAAVLEAETIEARGLLGAARWTFDARMSHPYGVRVKPEEARLLLARADDYDLIWFFNLRAAESFAYAVWRRSVVDIDDLASTYQRAALRAARGLAQRAQAWRRLYSWRRRERLLGERFTTLAVCSEQDRRALRAMDVQAPIEVIPNGFEAPGREPARCATDPPRLGFVGLYDYFPNRDGVEWFVRECWPQIKQAAPGVRLRLAGKDTRGALRCEDAQIDRLGWLEETDEEIASWSAMIVPIRVGGGTRIKIAHGFSRKCPVVATRFGAYGYDVADGRELRLADNAAEFAAACVEAILRPERAAAMAERAWAEFQAKWTWEAIRPRVRAAVETCLQCAEGPVRAEFSH